MHHLIRLAVAAVFACLAGAALADPPHPNLYKGERLVPIEVLPGKPVQLKGWTRDGKGLVYSLHVRAGEKVGVLEIAAIILVLASIAMLQIGRQRAMQAATVMAKTKDFRNDRKESC